MWEQSVSLLAAAMILVAYGAQQTGKLSPYGTTYLLLNLIGAAILAVIAFHIKQLGLIIVETVWMLISLIALIKLALRRK